MTEPSASYLNHGSASRIHLTLANVIEQFRTAMLNEGLTPAENIIADGKLRKFSTNGKKTDKAGWYVLYSDGIPSGSFGDFRTGIHKSWRADIGRPLTHVEEAAHRSRIAEIRRVQELEDAERKASARERASRIWAESEPCQEHPYLARKRIKPNGARIYKGELIIPIMAGEALYSLQFIGADGSKTFLTGGRVAGCYYIIGNPNGKTADGAALCIAEGFATGATIFEATGYPVVVALNAGNLGAVAKAIRDRFPTRSLIICADDDVNTTGNPGRTKATEAALSVGGLLAVPDFGSARPGNASDFNDMAMLMGPAVVRNLIVDVVTSGSVDSQVVDNKTTPINNPTPTANVAVATVAAAIPRVVNTSDRWPDPIPIATELKPVPAFAENLLPEPFRSWVMDITRRQSTAPDYVAVTALAALSAVIGRKARIYPKRYDDWLVVPNLWAMLIGRPSAGKTPAMREALKPLRRLAADALEQFKIDWIAYKATLKLQELKTKTAEKNARKALNDGDESLAIQLLAAASNEPQPPKQPRFIVNDATVEKLGELLNQNPNGLLLERDELYGWLHTLDREDRSNDRTFFLEASSGDGAYTYDRIGRGTMHIPALCLSIVGGIQPARLAPYIHQAVKGGNGDDGFIQRFQLAVYPDLPTFKQVDESPNIKAQNEVYQVFVALAALKPSNNGFMALRFDNTAQELFYDWFEGNEQIIRKQDLHPAMESHLIKFRKLIPALAVVIELAANPGAKTIGKTAIATACAWGQYLRKHADRIYNSAIDQIPVNALAILGKIRDSKLPNPFMYGDIRRGNWAGLTDKTDVASALDLLEERGFIRSEVAHQHAGKPTIVYNINPKIFS